MEYSLEYGIDELEMHADGVKAGDRVLLVDDLIATGGSAGAAVQLLQSLKAEVVGAAFVIDLPELGGMAKLEQAESGRCRWSDSRATDGPILAQ